MSGAYQVILRIDDPSYGVVSHIQDATDPPACDVCGNPLVIGDYVFKSAPVGLIHAVYNLETHSYRVSCQRDWP